MFDVGGPTLVFVTQTHHPILEHHTGYIFALYEMTMHKPRELFFSHVAEAQVYALHKGASLHMDPRAAPERLTALDYLLSAETVSPLGSIAEPSLYESRRGRRMTRQQADIEFDKSQTAMEHVEELAQVNFFGEDEA
jgi:hypothetical protein